MDLGASLADDNVAGQDKLAIVLLYSQHLGLGVAPVTGAAHTLLVGEQLQI
jgi:hypothetical protein